jgi:hypothetical protein
LPKATRNPPRRLQRAPRAGTWLAAPARMRGILAVVVLAACGGEPSIAALDQPSTAAEIHPDHIVVVVEENHASGQILGNADAPYINQLAARGLSFSRSYAIEHPSQPNYLDLFSGSNQGVHDDSCPHTFAAPNLGAALLAAGRTFAGYAEGLPAVGSAVCSAGNYWRKHAPWADFSNIPASANRPMTDFPSDLSQLPAVAFVIPDQQHDMHDGTVRQADDWLRARLGAYVEWAQTHNSLLIVTFDEDDHSAGNQITTLFVGPMVLSSRSSETITHYDVLRTILDLAGVAPIGSGAPIDDVWVPAAAPDWRRTVVFIRGVTQPGQDLFVRGGIDYDFARTTLGLDCTAQPRACQIPIRHRNLRNPSTAGEKQDDWFLDWLGAEPAQDGRAAGSPADWTTDAWPSTWGAARSVAVDGYGVEPLNHWGQHYWMLDVDMDCSRTVDGWFDVKSYISNGPGWEPGANHRARCGYVNRFERGSTAADVQPL